MQDTKETDDTFPNYFIFQAALSDLASLPTFCYLCGPTGMIKEVR